MAESTGSPPIFYFSSSDDSLEESEDTCVICANGFDDARDKVTLTEKGCITINSISDKFGEDVHAKPGNYVHAQCRHRYTNKNYVSAKVAKANKVVSPRKRRASATNRSQTDEKVPLCLFCNQRAKDSKKGVKSEHKLIPVRTLQCKESILRFCQERGDRDKWSRDVRGKVEYMQDLCAHDAVYHNICYTYFRNKQNIPRIFDTDGPAAKKLCFGRPRNVPCLEAFQCVIDYLDTADVEQITVPELVQIMQSSLTSGNTAYSPKYMKQKLLEHYGDGIVIAESAGTADVVTLKKSAGAILREFYKQPKSSDDEKQKEHLIKTAANLIRSDIKAMECAKDTYPEIMVDEQISFLPVSLRTLLSHIFKEKKPTVKSAAIGQATIQNTRPNTVLAPLQLGLGVQMHKVFRSRFLVDTLYQLGFSSSYTEVRKFELNAAQQQGIDLPPVSEEDTIQYVADNVDHNTVTLDGHNTFHGMGIIAVVTPGKHLKKSIPRRDVKLKDIIAMGRIGIHFYSSGWKNTSALVFTELPDIPATDPTSYYETLYDISWPLKSPRPSWKGMMQAVHSGDHAGVSEVCFMPMIDLNPGDLSCIYSTLKFVTSQARKYNVTPVLTFDQPLYQKALSIVTSEKAGGELQSIVLRLGTFHLQMSFLGSIGYLMSGSGLQEALELVFAPNAVVHMLNGKAYDRAVRGHLLVDAALKALLTADAYKLPWVLVHHDAEEDHAEEPAEEPGCSPPPDEEAVDDIDSSILQDDAFTEVHATTGDEDLDTAAAFLEKVVELQGNVVPENNVLDALSRVSANVEKHKEQLSTCRTGKLWLMYIDMVTILRLSIKAERTGNFLLHLQCVKDMLPYFAASGHNNYLKSARLYLQQMLLLQDTHPALYQRFLDGHHSIRRSDRYWAGLSPDLVIEQVLMRNLKTNGGLTRGSGMGENERLVWLLSMPSCAQINASMQLVTGVSFSTSEQHKDSSKTRQQQDHKDTRTLLGFFQKRNPFNRCGTLRSLSNGRTAAEGVNVDSAKELGQIILDSMTGSTVSDLKLKKKAQAVTLTTKSVAAKDTQPISIDSTLLFQRLVKVAETSPETVQSVFEFELTNIPTSLFETSGLPRPAKKHSLADYLWSVANQHSSRLPDDIGFVLDGGNLLHHLAWSRGATYSQVVDSYVDFVVRNYGTQAAVVFDGYICGPSIKDTTHLRRRSGRKIACEVDFDDDMLVCDTKESFLANDSNKQRFIYKLSDALKERGVEMHHADGDADCLIVRTALDKAKKMQVAVIGRDTDLLVLLLHHWKQQYFGVHFVSGTKVWDIREVQATLGPHVCRNILFGHAFGGCDTTSSLFSIGKKTPVQKLQDSALFRQQAEVFAEESQPHKVITEAGEMALVLLYGGKETDSLNTLRYIKYLHQLSSSTSALEPKRLPPTASAAQFHSLRAYFQVQVWMRLQDEKSVPLRPTEWGWEVTDGTMFPVYTDAAVAPEELLHVVKCNCKTDCTSARCSCRRHGLFCTAGCGECRGESCMNCLGRADGLEDVDYTDHQY